MQVNGEPLCNLVYTDPMCLATPMQIIQLQQGKALCCANGIQRWVDLYLVNDQLLSTGDYLLVHIGYAIEKIDRTLAEDNLRLINEAKNA